MNGSDLANGIATAMAPYVIGCAVFFLIVGASIGAAAVWLFW